MALNIFGALGAIGRLLPGYMRGERHAVQDNWSDLRNYNQVQAGQIQNAFDEAMFNPRLSMGYDAAANSRMGVYNTGMDLNVKRMGYPGMMQTTALGSILGPQLYAQMLMGQLGQAQAGANLWWNPQSQNYWGQYGIPATGWQGAWPWASTAQGGFQQLPSISALSPINPPSTVNP